jgi:pimeloyl-ACP methyl ester carboxylesterase
MPEAHDVPTNGVRLRVLQEGPADGPLAILLHGFPEHAGAWSVHSALLARAGYRVWAPDQRGYGRSAKPPRVADYSLDALAADVVGLIDAAGRERAVVIGHDWGAAVAWWVAARHPERVAKLVAINVPHPAAMRGYVGRSLAQLRKSWYILAFQIPVLPEVLAQRHDFRALAQALTSSSRPGTFTEDDLAAYRHAWGRPGAVRSMLDWYRAMLRHPPDMADARIAVPTLLLWGVQDVALERGLAQRSIDLCDDGRLIFFEDATRWVHHEEPERVFAAIAGFLGAGSD